MNYKIFFSAFTLLIVIVSCSSDPLDISVENKDLKISYINLDSILVNTPEKSVIETIVKTGIRKDQVISYQLAYCLGMGNMDDSSTASLIQKFIHDKYINRVEQRIREKFKNLNQIKENINRGFLYLNHHFPNKKLPENVVFINSLYKSSVFCTENEIAIGLERYLGSETDVIKELPEQEFFPWIKKGMNADYLERDVIAAWILTHFVPEAKMNTAEAIVRWGKIIYFTEAAFPKLDKNIIIRYSKKDYEWALENEYSFWKYLVDQKLLFSENERDQANFLNDAPFTIGLPEKGPDRLGQFLGWRMIQSYMEQYPETTLEEILAMPYNKILQEYEIE